MFPLRLLGYNLFVMAGLLTLLLLALFSRASPAARGPLQVGLAMAVFVGGLMLQGVLGIPWGIHLYPAKLIVVWIACVLPDALGRCAQRTP